MKNFVHKITCVLVMCAATVAFTACSDSDNKGDGPVTGTLSVETGALKFTSGAYSKGFEVGTDGTVGAIQIRTIAMDFWASLEHDIHYKADRAKLPSGIDEEMFACAEKIAEIDQQMQDMYRRIADAEANADAAKK